MEKPQIYDGQLHAPFFIYFRTQPLRTDRAILDHFGLQAYRPTTTVPSGACYVVMADVGEWTMLADDWYYHLWHAPLTWTAMETLARERDLFAWSIGDCDHSYEYKLYQGGRLVRQLTVDSPHFDDQVIRIDFGEPVPGEVGLRVTDQSIDQQMIQLTRNLGIDPTVTAERLRLYSRPYECSLDLSQALHNF